MKIRCRLPAVLSRLTACGGLSFRVIATLKDVRRGLGRVKNCNDSFFFCSDSQFDAQFVKRFSEAGKSLQTPLHCCVVCFPRISDVNIRLRNGVRGGHSSDF